jgi:hypothetical protein
MIGSGIEILSNICCCVNCCVHCAQVQAASEEAASACQEQSQQQLRQSVSQSQSLQLQLCWKLHQQLAQELVRLPRMEAAPLESMEAAMPVMVQLPQLTVTALLAVTEQQQAEQVCVLCL